MTDKPRTEYAHAEHWPDGWDGIPRTEDTGSPAAPDDTTTTPPCTFAAMAADTNNKAGEGQSGPIDGAANFQP